MADQNKTSKLFIGTLFSGENELSMCIDMINKQKYQNYKHIIYKYLPNKEAHDKLFSDFLSCPEFSYLIKIDADCVLIDENFFNRVVNTFKENPSIDLVAFYVYDFFEMIDNMSLNCYRQGFSLINKGELFTDRITNIPKDRQLISKYVSCIHCPDPSPFQAFHFGFHAQAKKRDISLKNTFKAFLKTLERKRAYALCGSIEFLKGEFDVSDLQIFNNPKLLSISKTYEKKSTFYLFCYVLVFYYLFNMRRQYSRIYNWVKRRFKK